MAPFVAKKQTSYTEFTNPSKLKLPDGFTICVIGASRGIGAGIAYAYALAGASHFLLAARRVDSLENVAARVRDYNPNARVEIAHCDVTTEASIPKLATKAQTEFDRLDVVFYNSGMSGQVELTVEEGDPRDFAEVYKVNVQGFYLTARYFLPVLRESKGGMQTLIAVGSNASRLVKALAPGIDIANIKYCTSKLAQARIVEMISEKHRDEGILTFSIHPGAVVTDMADDSAPDSFKPYLTDDPMLCGAFCAYLTQEKRMWLNGRLIDATWDMEKFLKTEKTVVENDLLKFEYVISRHEPHSEKPASHA